MSSTQHIVLTVDNKVVYDSSSPATTTPAPAAATEIDVKNLKLVSNPIPNTEYYFVTIDIDENPPVQSDRKKGTFISKREFPSGPNETTYEYTVADATGKNYTYKNWGSGGTQVRFLEIPAAAGNGGKRRNNRRKSAKKCGRSRRMRRMGRSNNRKSSRRF